MGLSFINFFLRLDRQQIIGLLFVWLLRKCRERKDEKLGCEFQFFWSFFGRGSRNLWCLRLGGNVIYLAYLRNHITCKRFWFLIWVLVFFFFSSQFYQQPNTGLGAKCCDSYWLAYLVGARRQIDRWLWFKPLRKCCTY